MSYTASAEVIDHIVGLIQQERPQWDASLVRVVLHSHASQVDGTDLAIAALRCAKDEKMPSPKAIGWRGPHWRDLATKPAEVKEQQWCGICTKPESRCRTERLADDDHEFEATGRPVRTRR